MGLQKEVPVHVGGQIGAVDATGQGRGELAHAKASIRMVVHHSYWSIPTIDNQGLLQTDLVSQLFSLELNVKNPRTTESSEDKGEGPQ